MAAPAYVNDVLELLRALPEDDIGRLLAEDTIDDNDNNDRVLLDLTVQTRNLRSALAVQQALQLAFDVAGIVIYRPDPERLTSEQVNELLDMRLVELTIEDLHTGSFFTKLGLNLKTPTGRRSWAAIFHIASVVLLLLGPPIAFIGVGLDIGSTIAYEVFERIAERGTQVKPKTVDVDVVDEETVTLTIERVPRTAVERATAAVAAVVSDEKVAAVIRRSEPFPPPAPEATETEADRAHRTTQAIQARLAREAQKRKPRIPSGDGGNAQEPESGNTDPGSPEKP